MKELIVFQPFILETQGNLTLEHDIARCAKLRFSSALASHKIRSNFEKNLFIIRLEVEGNAEVATPCNAG